MKELSNDSALPYRAEGSLWCTQGSKRAFDLIVSALALTLGFPFFLFIAFLVKLSSPGPILYCSMRIGRNGKLFKFWKFRSMHCNADEKLAQLLSTRPDLRDEWDLFFKLRNDPRLTKVGKWLRKTSLDEIPQFWNVLIGDLSIVGPRPYLPREEDTIRACIGKQAEMLFSVRPGLTGLWQTSGRNAVTFEKRIELDLIYIKERSFVADFKLFMKTIPMVLFGRGAY
jgi:undecaprenyl-phosphate galactose phosphotransferase